MAYENGRRVNRYAAKKHHQRELKRRHTPLGYDSYESYVAAKERQNTEVELWFQCRWSPEVYERHLQKEAQDRANGIRQYYECWWEGYTGVIGPGWKKNLKHFSKRKCRRFYKRFCEEISQFEDFDDYDQPPQKRFDDPWNWD